MPIPNPRKGEKEKEFISRCISAVSKLDTERPQKQVIAICYETWRRKKSKKGDAKMWLEEELAKITAMEAEREKRGMSVGAFYAFPRLKKLPIFDAVHVRNAMARFNQTTGWTAKEKATAKRKILRAAKKFGIDVGEFKELKRKASKFTLTSRQLGNEKNLVIYLENEEGFCDGWVFEPIKVAEKHKLVLGSNVKKLSYAPLDMISFDGIIPQGQTGAGRNYVGIYRILDKGTYEFIETDEKGIFKYVFNGKKLNGNYTVTRIEDRKIIESSKYQYTFDKTGGESLEDELLIQIKVLSKLPERTEEKMTYNSLKIVSELKGGKIVPLTIRGTALKEGNWNGLYYPTEEIRNAAILLQNKPLMLDHSKSVKDIVGRVNRTWFDETFKTLEFEAEVLQEDVARNIIEGLITSVSVGVIVDRVREGSNLVARNYAFKELSLILVPACSAAKIKDVELPV